MPAGLRVMAALPPLSGRGPAQPLPEPGRPNRNQPGPWNNDVLVHRVAPDGTTEHLATFERELDPAIDIVLSAHTHRGYNCVVGDRAVIQGASFGRLVSVVDVAIDRTTGDIDQVALYRDNCKVAQPLSTAKRMASSFSLTPLMKASDWKACSAVAAS